MGSPAAPSTSTSSNGKISKLAPSKRALFLASYRRNQLWSFPDSVIYYISKNPSSSKCYEKLIKTCKYFFVTNPVLVVAKLSIYYYKGEWYAYLNGNHVDLRAISSKIWITNILCHGIGHGNYHQYSDSSLLSKIYQNDAKIVLIYNQNIFYHDFVFLASNCKEIGLYTVKVLNNDGTAVALEKLIETLPNVKKLCYKFEDGVAASKMITSNTVKEMIKIPHFLTLDTFELKNLSDSFNIDEFYSYIKKNKNTKIFLKFYGHPLSDAYKHRLQEIINEIIHSEERGYRVPYIYFPGMERTSLNKSWELHRSD